VERAPPGEDYNKTCSRGGRARGRTNGDKVKGGEKGTKESKSKKSLLGKKGSLPLLKT